MAPADDLLQWAGSHALLTKRPRHCQNQKEEHATRLQVLRSENIQPDCKVKSRMQLHERGKMINETTWLT
jgi:hypothetical protein